MGDNKCGSMTTLRGLSRTFWMLLNVVIHPVKGKVLIYNNIIIHLHAEA